MVLVSHASWYYLVTTGPAGRSIWSLNVRYKRSSRIAADYDQVELCLSVRHTPYLRSNSYGAPLDGHFGVNRVVCDPYPNGVHQLIIQMQVPGLSSLVM